MPPPLASARLANGPAGHPRQSTPTVGQTHPLSQLAIGTTDARPTGGDKLPRTRRSTRMAAIPNMGSRGTPLHRRHRPGHHLVAAASSSTTPAAIVAVDQREHRQIFPRPGWVEHDAIEIWHNVQAVRAGRAGRAGIGAADLAAVGITNQRETTLLWDGRPASRCTTRSSGRTPAPTGLRRAALDVAGQDGSGSASGLPLATYFSGPKVRWLLDQDPRLRARAERARSSSAPWTPG